MTFVLVSVLYKHVCECIDDPFATPVTDATEGIMLDTGCSRTMVHSDLVSEGQIREGESAVVRCAHGDTVMYPMADICVELDGCTIDTVAAVSDTLPMDVLLGNLEGF